MKSFLVSIRLATKKRTCANWRNCSKTTPVGHFRELTIKLKNLDVNTYDLKTTKIHTCRKKGATAHSFVKVSCIFCMTLHNFDEIYGETPSIRVTYTNGGPHAPCTCTVCCIHLLTVFSIRVHSLTTSPLRNPQVSTPPFPLPRSTLHSTLLFHLVCILIVGSTKPQ